MPFNLVMDLIEMLPPDLCLVPVLAVHFRPEFTHPLLENFLLKSQLLSLFVHDLILVLIGVQRHAGVLGE